MPHGDFRAVLGDMARPGLLSQDERLERIRPGENPYITGTSLPANSPVFFGRVQVLHEILAVLRKSPKPGCVSLLGERRIGKSSLLNQVCQALEPESGLVVVHATAQDWNQESQQHFFSRLHQAVADAVGEEAGGETGDYPRFRDFIYSLARASGYRFVLAIDEFEAMAGNKHFDADFFSNLRALGDKPEYRFGYLISSRRPLEELCREHRIESSSFWGIFGSTQVLGLLSATESRGLVVEPLTRSLPPARRPDPLPLWRNEIEPRTGEHPALIQMVAAALWSALDGVYPFDPSKVRIHPYLEDLWQRRSPEEQAVLIRAATGQKLHPNAVVSDLTQRGLLTGQGKPFSFEFNKLIRSHLPKGKSAAQVVDELEKGAGRLNKWFEVLEKLAGTLGRLWKAFRNPGSGEEGADK